MPPKKGSYSSFTPLPALDIHLINQKFSEIEKRLSATEGSGQNVDCRGARLVNVGNPQKDGDAVNLGTLSSMISDASAFSIDGGNITQQVESGQIGDLTISDPPTQAEVEALRDRCEMLLTDLLELKDRLVGG